MSRLATGKIDYQACIERAELLAQRYRFAQEILNFYLHIARIQSDGYDQIPTRLQKRDNPVPDARNPRSKLNAAILLPSFAAFLEQIELHAPAPLSACAREVSTGNSGEWAGILTTFWTTGLLERSSADPLMDFLARAFLQPYAKYFLGSGSAPLLLQTTCRCPRCNSLPLLGVLRSEGDGGKRFLQCSFCWQEWEFRRIFCANCGEDKEQRLPVYVAEQFPHLRVECCETCKYFLRTVDLTKDGNAVPVVDDLAAIPLTLWAHENGYTRIQNNLLGT
jgi:formate dehydrogenase accessory protein FdhE